MRTIFQATLLLGFLAVGCSNSEPASSSTGGVGPAVPRSPETKFIPTNTGTCPTIARGKATFSPQGILARDVELYLDETAAASKDGPLVFFWHGAGGSPDEADYALGSAIDAIVAEGGVVAAAHHNPESGQLPWFLSLGGTRNDDLLVADEVLACVQASIGIDMRRIHSVGFSAGAMHTTQFAARRSGYLASIIVYSGARLGTPDEQDPTNLYPAMLFHGGPSDQVILAFETSTAQYEQALTDEGHTSVVCNHGMGHTVPADARSASWQFLQDHPFGESPEPYGDALPTGFPTYCIP